MTLLDLTKKTTEGAKKCALFAYREYESFKKQDIDGIKIYKENELFDKVVRLEKDIYKKDKGLYDRIKKGVGVYIFRIKETKKVDAEDFNTVDHGSPITDESITEFMKDDCLYVGKSDNFTSRMHSHFGNQKNRKGALRLSSEPREFMKENVIVYFFSFKKVFSEYYDVLARVIEKELHEKLKPVVGNK